MIRGSTSIGDDALLIQNPNSLHFLVRIVDDFLMISTDRHVSIRFLKKINQGHPCLGVRFNRRKTQVNYKVSLKNSRTGKNEPSEISSCCKNGKFAWCGLLIDTRTCEISLDLERFSGTHATDVVTTHHLGNEGLSLRKKMKDFVRPRCCQKLLFSSYINGLDTIRLNFYQTLLLCAVKTLHYLKNSVGADVAGRHIFIYNSVCDTIHFSFVLISSKFRHNFAGTKQECVRAGAFQLAWSDAFWLGRHAFYSVMRREGGHYTKLCQLFSQGSGLPVGNQQELIDVSKHSLGLFPLDRIHV